MKGTEVNQSINDYLVELHKKHGTLTPEIVVEDAKQPASPLHELFDWDKERAATAHWHDVARQLIRNVRVVIVNEGRVLKAPFFVRDPSLDNKQQGYTTVDRLRTAPELAREAVADECSRAAAAFRRAQEVATAVGVESDVHALLSQTLALSERVKTSA